MTTDPLGYRLFRFAPETLFLVFGMALDAAKAMAARYQFEAIEFKETSHRTDGVFVPKDPELPVYFVEMQFYWLPSIYANVLAKAYTYLKQHDPDQEYRAVVMFANRKLAPTGLKPYQPLLDAGLLRCIYLDEIPETANAPLGLAILQLIAQAEEQAVATARALIARAKREIDDASDRTSLIQFIETVIVYKLAHLSREEIETMLQVHDIRETRVYQEAKEEGLNEERQRTLQAIPKLAARQLSPADIADALGLDLDLVLKTMGKGPNV